LSMLGSRLAGSLASGLLPCGWPGCCRQPWPRGTWALPAGPAGNYRAPSPSVRGRPAGPRRSFRSRRSLSPFFFPFLLVPRRPGCGALGRLWFGAVGRFLGSRLLLGSLAGGSCPRWGVGWPAPSRLGGRLVGGSRSVWASAWWRRLPRGCLSSTLGSRLAGFPTSGLLPRGWPSFALGFRLLAPLSLYARPSRGWSSLGLALRLSGLSPFARFPRGWHSSTLGSRLAGSPTSGRSPCGRFFRFGGLPVGAPLLFGAFVLRSFFVRAWGPAPRPFAVGWVDPRAAFVHVGVSAGRLSHLWMVAPRAVLVRFWGPPAPPAPLPRGGFSFGSVGPLLGPSSFRSVALRVAFAPVGESAGRLSHVWAVALRAAPVRFGGLPAGAPPFFRAPVPRLVSPPALVVLVGESAGRLSHFRAAAFGGWFRFGGALLPSPAVWWGRVCARSVLGLPAFTPLFSCFFSAPGASRACARLGVFSPLSLSLFAPSRSFPVS